MCDLCEKYGENGGRWYLNPDRYARRIYRIESPEPVRERPAGTRGGAMGGDPEVVDARLNDPEKFAKIRDGMNEKFMAEQLDQIITLQEAQEIVEIAWPLTFVTCQCRREWKGLPDEENFGCMGLGSGMYKWERWPITYRGGVAFVTPEEAKEALVRMNEKGFVQRISARGAYACELCNCSPPICGGLRFVQDYGIRFVRKGHYVSKVASDRCDDCGRCFNRCQFGALKRDPITRTADINMFKCFGCGLCNEVCTREAIELVERATVPAVANLWW